MSFDLICQNCGASSGPSVGVCPFCKSVFTGSPNSQVSADIAMIESMFHKGLLSEALNSCRALEKTKGEDPNFCTLYAKILLESDGPSAKIQSLVMAALLKSPENQDAKDCMDISLAVGQLKNGANDPGEVILKSVIARSENNALAHFLLGAHQFWIDKNSKEAVGHLEKAVLLRPAMARAWGCLAAVYKNLGNKPLQKKAAETLLAIDTNPQMQNFVKKEFL